MVIRVFSGLMLASAVASLTHAASYTGTAPSCSSVSTPTTCKIDIADFMKSTFTYTNNGITYTSDSTNLAAVANTANTSSFRYIKNLGLITYNYDANSVSYAPGGQDQLIKEGFMNHPTLPNVLLHSKTQYSTTNGGPLEIFRWAGGVDNALYVIGEAQWTTGGFNSYEFQVGAPTMYWMNRGYFWADKVMDVTRNDPNNPNEWKSIARTWTGLRYGMIGANGAQTGRTDQGGYYRAFVRYLPSVRSAERGLNDGGGELPTSGTLEVLEVVVQRLASATATSPSWYEKYVYARQRLADGSYNSFGLVRFVSSQDYLSNPKLKCVNGVPPAGEQNIPCGDDDLLLAVSGHYNAFYNANDPRQGVTVKQWYDTVLAGPTKFQNDPKLTKRTDPDDATLPHNRGGFVPPGNGSDAKGTTVFGAVSGSGGDMMYLENTTFDQDWYIYPNGQDPLYAPSASPTNYCRDGYHYLASFPVIRSFNGLTQTSMSPGGLHWVIACGTSSNVVIQASNLGDAPCPSNYTTRGWYQKPTNLATTTCTVSGVCADQTSKGYINFCVSTAETSPQYPAPNP